jgi:hypothetical protein
MSMPKNWSPRDYAVLISVGSACLCLITLVLGAVLGVLSGTISSDVLGKIEGVGIGGGLLGFALIAYMIISVSLRSNSGDDGESS